jgi:hypothetical protein
MAKIYASDLDESKQLDCFMGKGFEEALRKAKENGNQLVVGEYCETGEWEED